MNSYQMLNTSSRYRGQSSTQVFRVSIYYVRNSDKSLLSTKQNKSKEILVTVL